MKKITAIFLALLLVLSACMATAETNQVLGFRDLQWGAGYKDVSKNSLFRYTALIFIGENSIKTLACLPGNVISASGMREFILGWVAGPTADVAGYANSRVYLYFAPYADKKGQINLKEDEMALFAGTYIIDTNQVDEVAEDLTTKLTSLYGEPDEKGAHMIEMIYEERPYILWKGAEDTQIILSWDNRSVNLTYAWTQGEEMLAQAVEYFTTKKSVPDAGNVSGL